MVTLLSSFSPRLCLSLVPAALAVALMVAPAAAQSNDNFLGNLFNRGDGREQPAPRGGRGGNDAMAQADPGELTVRLDRMENVLRQMTGTIEQLQYRNQQLEDRLRRMQEDTEFRFQQLGGRGGAAPAAQQPGGPPPPAAPAPGRRGDAFDPSNNPGAPGTPRTLGNQTASVGDVPVGAPGGREAGAPLDLGTLSANAAGNPAPGAPQGQPQQQLPPAQPPRVINGNPQLATLPPSAKPQDEYDLAYGYVLHKDYGLAEQAFRDFVRKYPNDRQIAEAQYWLGESLYQQQRYRDAAESFLAVSTKHDKTAKAPDSLLRLGQSLAALNKKEAACATLAEVERKYPKASATVKRTVTSEQKRVRC